jgi:hypothetical protein
MGLGESIGLGIGEAISVTLKRVAAGMLGERLAKKARQQLLDYIESSEQHKRLMAGRQAKFVPENQYEVYNGSSPNYGPIWVYYNAWGAEDRVDMFGFRTRGPSLGPEELHAVVALPRSEIIGHVVCIDGTTSYVRMEDIVVKDDRRAAPHVY